MNIQRTRLVLFLSAGAFDDDEPGGKPRRTKTKAARRNGKRKNVLFFFGADRCASSAIIATGELAPRFSAFYILLVGDMFLSAEFQSAAAAWCSILVSDDQHAKPRLSMCVW